MLQEHVRKYSRSTQTVLLFALAVILSLNHVMMSVALLVLMVGGVSGLTTVNVCAQLKGAGERTAYRACDNPVPSCGGDKCAR